MTSVSPPAPAASAGPEQPGRAVDHDVFIAHADDDTPFVGGELLPMLNLAVDRVILSSELPFPAFTEQAIEDSVRRSRLTIAVISPAYLRDRWAGFAELLSRNVHDDGRGGRLVPLVIAECEMPAILRQHATLDARTAQQREAAAARLREQLGRPDPETASLACPYPGMRPFSTAMAARFHGREREIESVLGRLHAGEREIYVIGPSGSGKSSLIAAGVLPRVQATADGDRFAVHCLRPGEHPAQRLAEALGGEPASFDGAVGRLLERAHCSRLLVFVDQLEELFTLADPEQRDCFIRALRVLRADRRCHLIAALRADFYGALMSSELWPDIEGRFTRLEVAPLRGDALRRAIETPAFEAGVYLERALVERLISDAAAEPGALPLLQEALVLLWARRSHRLLRLASYEALDADPATHVPGAHGAELRTGHNASREARSGIAVALARRADAALHDLTPAEQRVAQRIFLRLVSFGEGRPDTRRQQPRAALASCGTEDMSADLVIDRLIDARLLTSDATLRGEPLVDLAHEALIAGWPRLQHWLLSRRDDEQRRRLLELHAVQWVQRGRGSVGLFDAIELAEAERWIAGDTARELGHSDDLPRFLAASRDAIAEAERQRQLAAELQERERRAAQEERTRLRRRLARFAMIALALIAIVATSIGLVARRQRQEAERQRQEVQHQLARNELEQARSLVVERRDSPSAIPHLVEAARLGIDTAVLRTLLAATGRDLWRVRLRHGGSVSTAAFSPDGARVVTASYDGTARVWQITKTRALNAWVQQATSCLAQPTDAIGSPRICQLAEQSETAVDLVAPAQTLVAAGDRELYAHVWSTPRARYLQALSLLDQSSGSAPRQEVVVELRRSISTRLAILAAIEGRVAEARTLQGPDAPVTDALLLDRLGGVAHEDLHEEFVAVALLRRARERDPGDPSILADLAETYFATGQIEQFARTVAQIDQRRASPDVRLAIAALLWASGRLTGTAKAEAANQLLRAHRGSVTVTDANLQWSWNGTKHALFYGRHRYEDVKPIIDVLTLLEQPVTDATRAQLAQLLAAPAPPHPTSQR